MPTTNNPDYQKAWRKANPNYMHNWSKSNWAHIPMVNQTARQKQRSEAMENEKEATEAHRKTIFTGGYEKERKDGAMSLCWGYTEGEVL